MFKFGSRNRSPDPSTPESLEPLGPAGPAEPSEPEPTDNDADAPPEALEAPGAEGPEPEAGSTRLSRSRAVWSRRLEVFSDSRWPVVGFFGLVAISLAALVAAMVPIGPEWLGGAGAVALVTAYSWALAGRTGGRPVVFGTLALALGVGVLVSGRDDLATGAAVMTCVVSAVLAVMITVPAVTFLRAVRECVLALAVAAAGALATVAFEPMIALDDFEYTTFGLALLAVLVVVYRLGAGLHGLGRRGIVIVLVGGALVVVTLLYAELLRRYGTTSLVDSSLDIVRWSRNNLGAFPRPIEAVLGVPALAYGVHMRARRRQGWWVCAFGVAATSATANSLANPAVSLTEGALSVLYGLVVGLVIAFVVIRLDLFLTGSSGGARRRGRRSRVDEEAAAVRPEPRRNERLY